MDLETGEGLKCPVCGEGVLSDVAYANRVMSSFAPHQDADAREVRRYSCGHEWVGAALGTVASEEVTVERRASEDTVEPVDGEDAEGHG